MMVLPPCWYFGYKFIHFLFAYLHGRVVRVVLCCFCDTISVPVNHWKRWCDNMSVNCNDAGIDLQLVIMMFLRKEPESMEEVADAAAAVGNRDGGRVNIQQVWYPGRHHFPTLSLPGWKCPLGSSASACRHQPWLRFCFETDAKL